MKTLQTKFEANVDKTGVNTFEQIKRTNEVALYKRTRPTGTEVFEVFIIKVVPKGAKLPGGAVVAEEYESYPGAASFGKSAYFCTNEDRADAHFGALVEKVANRTETLESAAFVSTVGEDVEVSLEEPGCKRGRKAVIRPAIVFPTTEQWTMKDLVGINSEAGWNQPLLYLAIKNNPQVVEVGEVKGGRGKPAKIYKVLYLRYHNPIES